MCDSEESKREIRVGLNGIGGRDLNFGSNKDSAGRGCIEHQEHINRRLMLDPKKGYVSTGSAVGTVRALTQEQEWTRP